MRHPVLLSFFAASFALGAMAQSTEPALYQEVVQYSVKVDKQARYPGGPDGVLRFIAQHIRYPQEAMRAGVTGRVFVKFTVGTKGKIKKVEAIRSDSPLLARGAANIFVGMKKWTPAYLQEKPVEVAYVFPVTFKLDR